MPAPPPNGRSSTDRCRLSVEKSLRLWILKLINPRAWARPSRLCVKGPSNIEGNKVMMSSLRRTLIDFTFALMSDAYPGFDFFFISINFTKTLGKDHFHPLVGK